MQNCWDGAVQLTFVTLCNYWNTMNVRKPYSTLPVDYTQISQFPLVQSLYIHSIKNGIALCKKASKIINLFRKQEASLDVGRAKLV